MTYWWDQTGPGATARLLALLGDSQHLTLRQWQLRRRPQRLRAQHWRQHRYGSLVCCCVVWDMAGLPALLCLVLLRLFL